MFVVSLCRRNAGADLNNKLKTKTPTTTMIINILLGVVAVIAILLIVVALRPAEFRVERSATLSAPAIELFEQVNDHRKFAVWNPFMKLDPNVKNTYTGPDSGVGAACSWEGNNKIGAGSATIIESKPGELVRQRMDWLRPMKGTSTVEFTFKPAGEKTVVTWAMYGKNGFMGKLFSLFINCEKMVGPQFEQGLAELGKVVAVAAPSPR
jgi:Polyketide cyclase / dehydrase and lipid transport